MDSEQPAGVVPKGVDFIGGNGSRWVSTGEGISLPFEEWVPELHSWVSRLPGPPPGTEFNGGYPPPPLSSSPRQPVNGVVTLRDMMTKRYTITFVWRYRGD